MRPRGDYGAGPRCFEDALEWAAKMPCMDGGAVEVREQGMS